MYRILFRRALCSTLGHGDSPVSGGVQLPSNGAILLTPGVVKPCGVLRECCGQEVRMARSKTLTATGRGSRETRIPCSDLQTVKRLTGAARIIIASQKLRLRSGDSVRKLRKSWELLINGYSRVVSLCALRFDFQN